MLALSERVTVVKAGSYGEIEIRAMVSGSLYSTVGKGVLSARPAGWVFNAGIALSIPNLITLGRILLVPVVVWAIMSNAMWFAFMLFLVAGVSDAVDGYLAKRFNMTSELGALLDPLADKALLVSIYVALGIWGAVPRWIVILVVSRDIMIVTAVIVSWLFGKPVPMKPLMVSKLNTVAQVAFAALVLAALGFGFNSTPYDLILMGLVTVFTLVSVSLYLVEWVRHMSTIEAK